MQRVVVDCSVYDPNDEDASVTIENFTAEEVAQAEKDRAAALAREAKERQRADRLAALRDKPGKRTLEEVSEALDILLGKE